eukprot:superscaffoldBa00004081_g18227
MGASWISWRTTLTAIITILQIPALIGVKTSAVIGLEGQRFDFRCEYPHDKQNNAKYFWHVVDNIPSDDLIWTNKHDQLVRKGRFSLYDNTTGTFFIVSVDKLVPVDSGTYWCGVDVSDLRDHISVIQLNVSRVTVTPISQENIRVDMHNLPLFLTAVMCVAALLFVCLFTLCLLLAVKHRRSGPRQNRETSSDYEAMTPDVRTELELRCGCSDPDCADLSASSPTKPDLCAHFTTKQRESTVSFGLDEYADVDVSGNICQYQQLDLSRLEEHVYDSLHGNNVPKDGPLAVKEKINC